VLTASTTAPCIDVRYPQVDRLVSGQSWKDESVNLIFGARACPSLPLSAINRYKGDSFTSL
jgi:hypothetical protein